MKKKNLKKYFLKRNMTAVRKKIFLYNLCEKVMEDVYFNGKNSSNALYNAERN